MGDVTWEQGADIEHAVVATAACLAAAVAVWLVVSVAGWAVVIRRNQHRTIADDPSTHRHRTSRWLRLTMPGARRLAEAMLGTAALLLTSCVTSADTTAPTLTRLEADGPVDRPTTLLSTALPPATNPPTTGPPATEPPDGAVSPPTSTAPSLSPSLEAPPEPPLPASVPTVHVVEAGDSLWTIARDLTGDRIAAPPTERQTATTWRSLIELNRDRLVSGDLDLIHPGEELLLPAPDTTPTER